METVEGLAFEAPECISLDHVLQISHLPTCSLGCNHDSYCAPSKQIYIIMTIFYPILPYV